MRQRTTRTGCLFVATTLLASLAGGCTRSSPQDQHNADGTGQVSLAFKLDNGVELRDLVYTLSGKAIAAITRHADVTKVLQVMDTVKALPAGMGYSIAADAQSPDGKTACHSQGTFEIIANQTTTVTLTLLCRLADGGVGSVSLNGSFDGCPVIASEWRTANAVSLGAAIKLGVTAHDPDPADDSVTNPLTYDWSMAPAGLGSFLGAAGKPTQNFLCRQVGSGKVSVTVGDGSCSRTSSVDVECQMNGEAPPASGTCVSITGYSVGARYDQLRLGEALPVAVTATSAATKALKYTWAAKPSSGGSFADAHAASTTFSCTTAGSIDLSVQAADGVCAADVRDPAVKVTCLPAPQRRHDGGVSDGPSEGSSEGPSDGPSDGPSEGPPTNGGTCPESEPASTSADCDTCTAANLDPTDGCCSVANLGDRSLCATVARCFSSHPCTISGDATNCFCGSSGGNCFSKADAANGPCTAEVIAAAKTSVPADIHDQFTSPASPLGHAVGLLTKRGSFCGAECGVP